ncbi:recombination DNA endonuclease [Caulobacter phage DCM]|uniref:Recombination DNA endonuclease n=1 Tax=Caulobacter phage DCM TaxID=3020391 RepID=A0AAE9X0Z2_9CAUD|nr:recombination DNA endonuclease [Caulobacter phage DCM]WCD56106.1 recombination DNA endonuclease [Caulobacter phage BL199]
MKHSEIEPVRTAQIAAQGNRCALCGKAGVASDPVLDHCHKTGAVRGTLHRSCNALLGKVENNAGRFGVAGHLMEFCFGIGPYLQKHKFPITGLIHPTHKTEDEKRIARNAKARKTRAAAKAKG